MDVVAWLKLLNLLIEDFTLGRSQRYSVKGTGSHMEAEVASGFSQPKDGLIADGHLLGAIHRNRFNPRSARLFLLSAFLH